MRSVSGIGRIAALGAVIAAVALVAIVLFGGGKSAYSVKATFVNAAQLVNGNEIKVNGVAVGTVKDIAITDNSQAEVTFEVSEKYAPLRQGTKAIVKQTSLSGIANRYIDLQMPDGTAPPIADGGSIGIDNTQTAVDLDELFNLFDPVARVAVQDFVRGSAESLRGQGQAGNRAIAYLNPALSTTSRLFNELTKDTPLLERFLIDSAKLVTTLEERHDDLAGVVGNLNTTTRALGNERAALAESINRLPGFMRRANTTFVNLRAALDDVDPLVDASKPVARELGPFLTQARGLANDAVPTVRDLSRTVRRPGPDNDLINLTNSFPPLARVALDDRRINGATRRGAFPESEQALRESAPVIAFARPYTNDFLGWFDDFSTTGAYVDALGGIARGQIKLNENVQLFENGSPSPAAEPGPVKQGIFRPCPGSGELAAPDGSNVYSGEDADRLACEPGQTPGDVP